GLDRLRRRIHGRDLRKPAPLAEAGLGAEAERIFRPQRLCLFHSRPRGDPQPRASGRPEHHVVDRLPAFGNNLAELSRGHGLAIRWPDRTRASSHRLRQRAAVLRTGSRRKTMTWEAENETLIREAALETKSSGFTITRGRDAHPHAGNKRRAAKLDPSFVEHPAIVRGIQQFRETADCGGAAALTLFSMPN